MKDKIIKYIDKNKQWFLDGIINIVSVNTVNNPPTGNENNGQNIIEKIFLDMGLEIDRFSPDDVIGFSKSITYLKGRDYKNRDNLIGKIGDNKENTLIFNGHIDTVPTENSKWKKVKPFKPELINNRIYGLGACDMKGGLFSSIYALKSIIDLGIRIKGKVIIESVIDEEFGGANGSLACIKRGYTGDFAIIAEPTNMDICVSNVSSRLMNIKIIGDKGLMYLGNKNEGINPILLASKLIAVLKEYEFFLNSLKSNYDFYKDIEKPMKFLFSDIKAGEIGPDKIITTPEECFIRVYMMNYPDISMIDFTNMMLSFIKKYQGINKYLENKKIVFDKRNRFIEGGNLDINVHKNKNFVNTLIRNGKILANRELKLNTMLGGTDFFTFSNYGNTPVVILGPSGGNCHASDEYVNFKDLLDLSKIYAGFIYDYCC